jgi:hypothetical protein
MKGVTKVLTMTGIENGVRARDGNVFDSAAGSSSFPCLLGYAASVLWKY